MRKSTFTPEQILQALRQAEAGTVVGDICRKLGAVEFAAHRFRVRSSSIPRYNPNVSAKGPRSAGAARIEPLVSIVEEIPLPVRWRPVIGPAHRGRLEQRDVEAVALWIRIDRHGAIHRVESCPEFKGSGNEEARRRVHV